MCAWDLEYGNTQSLSAGDLTIFDGLSEFSLHAHAWLEDNTIRHHVMGKGDSSNFLRFYFEPAPTNGKLRVPKAFVGIGGVTVRAEGGNDDDFPLQEWVSYGMSFRTNQVSGLQVLIDGAVKGTGATNIAGMNGGETFVNTATDFYVGRQSASPSSVWDGKLGEVAAWRVELDADDWAALAAGVSALYVRPEELIFFSPMSGLQATEHYWLPLTDTIGDFTHGNAPVAVEDEYAQALGPQAELRPFAVGPAGGTTYGPFARIATVGAVASYRDGAVEAGKTYKYKIRAFDTAPVPNLSGYSSEVEVTPATGIDGPERLPYARGRRWKAIKVRARTGRGPFDPPV